MILPQKYHPLARLFLQFKPITANQHIFSSTNHRALSFTRMILSRISPIPSISLIYPIYDSSWSGTHRIHFIYLPDRSMTHSTSTNTLLDSIGMQPCDDFFHSQSLPSKAFMLLRQGVSLRTVCIRRLVRIGRQGLRLLRCFCFCGEHACLSAAYRSLLRSCLYVCLGCLLLAARPVRICVLPMCTCATCEQADACWCGQECDICGSERMARPVARYM